MTHELDLENIVFSSTCSCARIKLLKPLQSKLELAISEAAYFTRRDDVLQPQSWILDKVGVSWGSLVPACSDEGGIRLLVLVLVLVMVCMCFVMVSKAEGKRALGWAASLIQSYAAL